MTARRAILLSALLAGVALRVFALDRLPGINADEAWYGVNVEAFLHGEPPFLRTGVGNPLNPLHSLPLLALSSALSPSLAVLRVPSVLWGVAAMLLAFPLLVKPLGERVATLAVLLLSILPAAVAYSRFGWDPSDTPAVALLAIGCAMGDRPLLAAGALIVALAVLPTNVFLAPIVAASWAPFALAHYQRASRGQRQIALVTTIGLVVLAIAIGFMLRESVGPDTSLPPIATVIARVTSPAAWRDLMLGVIRLFSGVTIARHIAGPIGQTPAAVADVITLLAFAVAMVVRFDRLMYLEKY